MAFLKSKFSCKYSSVTNGMLLFSERLWETNRDYSGASITIASPWFSSKNISQLVLLKYSLEIFLERIKHFLKKWIEHTSRPKIKEPLI